MTIDEDRASSTSRQHYIDTGHYLRVDESCICDATPEGREIAIGAGYAELAADPEEIAIEGALRARRRERHSDNAS